MSLDQPNGFVKPQSITTDAFLGGRINVSQPRDGFRAGLDSVLLGAAVNVAAQSLLDLGAGAGTAALVALAHNPNLSAVLAENEPGMLDLARGNIEANGFAARAVAVAADVTAGRALAGLRPAGFDTVMANPPYFPTGGGTPAREASRAAARQIAPGSLDLWVRTAARRVRPGGEVVFIHRAETLPDLLAAFAAVLGAVTLLPLAPRGGEPATRMLLRGIKGSRAPFRLAAPFALHEGGGFSPRAEDIFRGTARLHW